MNVLRSLVSHRSIQVLIVVGLYLLLAPFLHEEGSRVLYSISLLLKDLLLWILPLTVAFFLAHAVCSFDKKAPLFLILLFLFEAFSNFTSVWYSYFCSQWTYTHLTLPHALSEGVSLEPLWRLPIERPSWWSASKGSFCGILAGLLANFFFPTLRSLLSLGKQKAEWVLTQCFSRLIPLFVLGFVARTYQTKSLQHLLKNYTGLLLWLVGVLFVYQILLLFVGSGCSWRASLRNGKNLLPAIGIAFTTGCSLSTMPWTIEGAGKGLKNPSFAKAIIPATTNIQQIGDCIANSFLCFLLFCYFHGTAPDLSIWVPFSVVFVLARFATAAVLGGAIFIMLPIYETYLHFTPEMSVLILAFNVLLDPLITCSNVFANGSLCLLFEKLWNRLSARKQTS